MDINLYQQYLEQYIKDAISKSDGTNKDISNRLWEIKVSGILVRHREEKTRALDDARKAFDEHRHWPLEIVLSHIGLDPAGNMKR